MTPRKGSLAVCGMGCLGLITEDAPQEVTYPAGNKGIAYVGIHLTAKMCSIGEPWSARHPFVVGHVDDLMTEYDVLKQIHTRKAK
jgi:hypothetical protein